MTFQSPSLPKAPDLNLLSSNQYLPFIDGLRALAVLSVIVFHLRAIWLPGGFLGVDLFFVISGYVVSRAASQIPANHFLGFFSAFYARRMARIIPPLLACLLISFIFTTLFIPPAWLTQAIDQTGLWAYFGLSNIVLARSAGDYFSPIAELNPFTHTWSLGIEEQFYLAFAFAFFLWNKSKLRITFILCGLIALTSLGYSAYLAKPTQLGYYLGQARAWELALGVLLFQWQFIKSPRLTLQSNDHSFAKRWTIVFCLCLILAAFFFISPAQSPFPGALWVVLPALVLLHLCQTSPGKAQRLFLESRISCFIGKMSYSLYLWHWPIFIACKWTIGLEGGLEKLIALAITILFSLLSYFWVELPTRARLKRVKPIICILTCIGATVICYNISKQLIHNKNSLSQSHVVHNQALWYPNAIFNQDTSNPCSAQESTKTLGGTVVWIYQRGSQCALPKRSMHVLYVLGDSHALQYRALLAQFTSLTGIPTHLYSNGGCPFMSLLPEGADHSKACQENGRTSYADIEKKIQDGDYLFLSSLRTLRRVDQWGPLASFLTNMKKMSSSQTQKAIQEDVVSYRDLLEPLSKRGVSLVLSAPTPTWGFVPFRCDDWFNHMNPICSERGPLSKAEFSKLRAPIMLALNELKNTLPNVKIWDALPLLCPQEQCESKAQGLPLYFDGDHLSAHANLLLEPSFEALILSPSSP